MAEKELYVVYYDDGSGYHQHMRAVVSLEKAQHLVARFRREHPRMTFGYVLLEDFLSTLV